MRTLKVVYQVAFECVVSVGGGENEQDALCDIDIPEGGKNGSTYRKNSFKILSHEEVVKFTASPPSSCTQCGSIGEPLFHISPPGVLLCHDCAGVDPDDY